MLIKTGESKECGTCHYRYFPYRGFQPDVCNGWHDVLMMSMNHSDIAILNMKDADYSGIICEIGKEAGLFAAKSSFKRRKQNIIKHKTYYYIKKFVRNWVKRF